MEKAYLYFENDLFIEANSFGGGGSECGEIVFNTSMTGYQEILSDPSYAGQFIAFTMPEIGIVGTNNHDIESNLPYAKGIIVRKYNDFYSNFRANKSLSEYLKEHNILGITNIDTRYITEMIRDNGAMMLAVSTSINSKDGLKELLESSIKTSEARYTNIVSTKEVFKHKTSTYDFNLQTYPKTKFTKKIVVIDFGIKKNILNELSKTGLECEVINSKFDATCLIDRFNNKEIGGVFLSNGPGNPEVLNHEIEEIKKLIKANIPMFGICLGHQLLSIAHGYPTYKLHFGHHGANHPVKNTLTNKIEITAQNHIYSIPESIREIADVTHINLFDNTIEGLKYKNSPIISIQHHPEASPGPKEANAIFKDFFEMVRA